MNVRQRGKRAERLAADLRGGGNERSGPRTPLLRTGWRDAHHAYDAGGAYTYILSRAACACSRTIGADLPSSAAVRAQPLPAAATDGSGRTLGGSCGGCASAPSCRAAIAQSAISSGRRIRRRSCADTWRRRAVIALDTCQQRASPALARGRQRSRRGARPHAITRTRGGARSQHPRAAARVAALASFPAPTSPRARVPGRHGPPP